jgi:hypothetical protein
VIEEKEALEKQMSTDEFIGEVIGIFRLLVFSISISEADPDDDVRIPEDERVYAFVSGRTEDETAYTYWYYEAHSRTMGGALRKVREKIREQHGK